MGNMNGVSFLKRLTPFQFDPVTVSENRRYLVDQKSVPFLIHGDAAWSIITGLTKAEAEVYLEDRRSKGFNSIILNFIEHKFNGPANRNGDGPFTVRGDFDTPNEKYFEHAEFPHVKKQFWGRHLWARGYFCCSSGNVTDEIVAECIANQNVSEG